MRPRPPWTPPPRPSTSNPTGWRRPRNGCSTCAGLARKLGVSVEELPTLRTRFAERLRAVETSEDALKAAEGELRAAREAYLAEAAKLTAARRPPPATGWPTQSWRNWRR